MIGVHLDQLRYRQMFGNRIPDIGSQVVALGWGPPDRTNKLPVHQRPQINDILSVHLLIILDAYPKILIINNFL